MLSVSLGQQTSFIECNQWGSIYRKMLLLVYFPFIFSAWILCFYTDTPLLPNKKVSAHLYVQWFQLGKFSVVKVLTSVVLIGNSMFTFLFSCVEFHYLWGVHFMFCIYILLLPVRFIEVHVLTEIWFCNFLGKIQVCLLLCWRQPQAFFRNFLQKYIRCSQCMSPIETLPKLMIPCFSGHNMLVAGPHMKKCSGWRSNLQVSKNHVKIYLWKVYRWGIIIGRNTVAIDATVMMLLLMYWFNPI